MLFSAIEGFGGGSESEQVTDPLIINSRMSITRLATTKTLALKPRT